MSGIGRSLEVHFSHFLMQHVHTYKSRKVAHFKKSVFLLARQTFSVSCLFEICLCAHRSLHITKGFAQKQFLMSSIPIPTDTVSESQQHACLPSQGQDQHIFVSKQIQDTAIQFSVSFELSFLSDICAGIVIAINSFSCNSLSSVAKKAPLFFFWQRAKHYFSEQFQRRCSVLTGQIFSQNG